MFCTHFLVQRYQLFSRLVLLFPSARPLLDLLAYLVQFHCVSATFCSLTLSKVSSTFLNSSSQAANPLHSQACFWDISHLAAIDTFSRVALKSSSFFYHIERDHPDANHNPLLKYLIQTFGALTNMFKATCVGVKVVQLLCSLVWGWGCFQVGFSLASQGLQQLPKCSTCETRLSFSLGYLLGGDITDSIIFLSLQDMTTCPNKMDFFIRQGILSLGYSISDTHRLIPYLFPHDGSHLLYPSLGGLCRLVNVHGRVFPTFSGQVIYLPCSCTQFGVVFYWVISNR